MKKTPKFDGPIPGENYTSDTKNYPWHRPPEEADFVKIVDKAITKMNQPEKVAQILTALESGETIMDYVTGTARITVGDGRIPIDMAVLAAGPIAKFIETVAKNAGIDYERGWEQEPRLMTANRLKAYTAGVPKKALEEVAETPEATEPAAAPAGGLMGPSDDAASDDAQLEMLGYGAGESE